MITVCQYPSCMSHTIPGCRGPCQGTHPAYGAVFDVSAARIADLERQLAEAQALIYAARQERDAAEDAEKEMVEELRTVKRQLAEARERSVIYTNSSVDLSTISLTSAPMVSNPAAILVQQNGCQITVDVGGNVDPHMVYTAIKRAVRPFVKLKEPTP